MPTSFPVKEKTLGDVACENGIVTLSHSGPTVLNVELAPSGSALNDLPTSSYPPRPPPGASRQVSSATTPAVDLSAFFTCPITKQLFQDPVVLEDGISYERSAVVEQNPSILYPNRALKSIMQDMDVTVTVSIASNGNPPTVISSGVSGIATANTSTTAITSIVSKHSLLQQAKRFFTVREDRPLPDAFYCPITLQLMHQPVLDPQGYTYERLAIVQWIYANGNSPVTRESLQVSELVPNHALQRLLQAEADREDDEKAVHPAILKWKKESSVGVWNRMMDLPPSLNDPATRISSDGTFSNRNAAATAPIVPFFPTTPEQLEAQLEDERRRRMRIRLARMTLTLLFLAVIVAGFFVPILGAIVVVLLVGFVWHIMFCSTGSSPF